MYVINKGNRYGGLQLSPVDVSLVMCYCGLTVGKYGTSRRCTVRCPGSDVDTQVCGNILVNSVIYVYRGRSTRSTSIHSNTLSRSYLRQKCARSIAINSCCLSEPHRQVMPMSSAIIRRRGQGVQSRLFVCLSVCPRSKRQGRAFRQTRRNALTPRRRLYSRCG